MVTEVSMILIYNFLLILGPFTVLYFRHFQYLWDIFSSLNRNASNMGWDGMRFTLEFSVFRHMIYFGHEAYENISFLASMTSDSLIELIFLSKSLIGINISMSLKQMQWTLKIKSFSYSVYVCAWKKLTIIQSAQYFPWISLLVNIYLPRLVGDGSGNMLPIKLKEICCTICSNDTLQFQYT